MSSGFEIWNFKFQMNFYNKYVNLVNFRNCGNIENLFGQRVVILSVISSFFNKFLHFKLDLVPISSLPTIRQSALLHLRSFHLGTLRPFLGDKTWNRSTNWLIDWTPRTFEPLYLLKCGVRWFIWDNSDFFSHFSKWNVFDELLQLFIAVRAFQEIVHSFYVSKSIDDHFFVRHE